MAMPHETQKRLIEKRIKDKFGSSRIRELKKIADELPNFSGGPYADLRKWVKQLITDTKTRSKIKHQDWLGIKREGEAQIVLVGPPNIGKSSLLKQLTDKQIKVANYAFTTLKPIPSILLYEGLEIQLVEIPGLIKGASQDRGGGKRLLGVVREADGMVIMCDLTQPNERVQEIISELDIAGIKKPMIVVANKADLPGTKQSFESLQKVLPTIIPISVTLQKNLDVVKEKIWQLTGLIKVYTEENSRPIALKQQSTVRDLAQKLHKDFLNRFSHAIVKGISVKFNNQRVGLDHVLEDNDMVKFVLKK